MRWSATILYRHLAKIGCRFHRHSVACVSSLHACRSSASRLGDRTGRQRQRRTEVEEFNKEFGRKIVWVPWQRPGFELALLIEQSRHRNAGAKA